MFLIFKCCEGILSQSESLLLRKKSRTINEFFHGEFRNGLLGQPVQRKVERAVDYGLCDIMLVHLTRNRILQREKRFCSRLIKSSV